MAFKVEGSSALLCAIVRARGPGRGRGLAFENDRERRSKLISGRGVSQRRRGTQRARFLERHGRNSSLHTHGSGGEAHAGSTSDDVRLARALPP